MTVLTVMTYLASCSGACSDFDGSTGNVWVKIDQAGYDASEEVPWASKRLPTQNSTWPVTLPSSIVAGEYLLRYVLTIANLVARPALTRKQQT
jgi:lytic cellulose monooxygenase (C1-hydroxylating)